MERLISIGQTPTIVTLDFKYDMRVGANKCRQKLVGIKDRNPNPD